MDDAEDVEATLRGVSDQFFLAVRTLSELERRKRATVPADVGFGELSREVRVAAAEVLRIAIDQERLAEAVGDSEIQTELDPIEEVAPPKSLATILEEWRGVERELAIVAADSPEAAELMERFADLRRRYATALARVRSDDGRTGA